MINTDDCTGTELIRKIIQEMEDHQTSHVAIPVDFLDGTLYLSIELLTEEDLFEDTFPELTSTRTLQ